MRKNEREKCLKKLFLSQNKNVMIQNLEYNDNFIPRDDALVSYYSKIMNNPQIYNATKLNEMKEIEKKIINCEDSINHNIKKIIGAMRATNSIGASGNDEITQPHFDNKQKNIAKNLQILYKTWSNLKIIPTFIQTGTITSFPKFKDAVNPKDFRPITLLPIICKIYERLLLTEMKHHGLDQKLHPPQGGFCSKRGILEQLGTLRIVAEHLSK